MVRVKRRYILFKIKCHGNHQVNRESFLQELRDKVTQMYGDFGIACLNRGFSIKKFDPRDGYMIFSVRKGVHDMIMSVVPIITTVDKNLCSVAIVHLSGTIRGCLKHLKLDYLMDVRATIAAKNSKAQVFA